MLITYLREEELYLLVKFNDRHLIPCGKQHI